MEEPVNKPCYNIVSCRLSDEELEKLTRWTDATGMSISKILRNAVNEMDVLFGKHLQCSDNQGE